MSADRSPEPTCYVTLTSTVLEECQSGVTSVSERRHLWGDPHDLTNTHPDASMFRAREVIEYWNRGSSLRANVGDFPSARASRETWFSFSQVVLLEPSVALIRRDDDGLPGKGL